MLLIIEIQSLLDKDFITTLMEQTLCTLEALNQKCKTNNKTPNKRQQLTLLHKYNKYFLKKWDKQHLVQTASLKWKQFQSDYRAAALVGCSQLGNLKEKPRSSLNNKL